jgi:hypothetical protein
MRRIFKAEPSKLESKASRLAFFMRAPGLLKVGRCEQR